MASVNAPIYVNGDVKALRGLPFLPGAALRLMSLAGTTLYSAESATAKGSTNYQKFTGDGLTKAFPITNFTAANTTGGAVSAANQLLTVVTLNGTPKLRARGDAAVAAAANVICSAGGGTAAGQADLTLKASTAVAVGANSIFVKEASGTNTIVVGDKINIAGDTTDYYATATTATLDGTGVEIAITPPIKKAVASGDSNTTAVTVAAPSKPVAIFYTAPANGDVIEAFSYASGEITTVTGGAMTAGREYREKLGSFVHAAGALSIDG